MKKLKLKKWHKMVLYVLGLVILFIMIGVLYTNYIVSNIIEQKLNERLVKIKGKTVRYEKIRVNILTESISIYGLYYSTEEKNNSLNENKEGYEVYIKKVNFDYINIINVLKTKDLDINNITIIEPDIKTNIGAKQEKEVAEKGDFNGYKKLLETIASLNIEYVEIINASTSVKSINSKFELHSDSTNISIKNLRYNLNDSTLSYNDSSYYFHIRNIRFVRPDSQYLLTIKAIETYDEGEIYIRGLRYLCTVPKDEITQRNGNVPTAWNDINLKEIKTTKCNIIKKILEGKIEFDSLKVQGNYILVYKDNIPPPTKARKMLQQTIMGIKEPINFKHIEFKLPHFIYQEIDKDTDVGEIELDYLTININNLKNELYNTIFINAVGSIRNGGMVDINLYLDLNPQCSFKCKAILTDCDGKAFNPFLMPIVGAEIKKCNINYLFTRFTGDSTSTNGIFTMAYNDFSAKILKGESPYSILAKNRGAINFVSQFIIPESNPKVYGEDPKSFTISYNRNVFKPFGNYLIMTLLDGVKKTFVPEFYLENQIKITRSISELSKLDKKAKDKKVGRPKGYVNMQVLELNEKLIKLRNKLINKEKEFKKEIKDTLNAKNNTDI